MPAFQGLLNHIRPRRSIARSFGVFRRTPSRWAQRLAKARVMALHERFVALGLESPFNEEWLNRPSLDDRITTQIDVREHDHVRREALLAHATQVDPNSPFWFGLPAAEAREAYPFEDFVLARSLVPSRAPEHDLFSGVRLRREADRVRPGR